MPVSEQQHAEWASIGKVVAPFGVQGELKVRLLSDIPNRFQELDEIYAGSAHRLYAIQSVRSYKGEMILLKLKGLDDANAAEALRNEDLSIPLHSLAELPTGTYYQHDIFGLRVFTLDEIYLGDVVDIISTGSNDVYAVQSPGSPGSPEVLIPAIKDIIKQIDLQKRVMYIDPIPGLLDNSDRNLGEEEDKTIE